jgi:hypothetical protein
MTGWRGPPNRRYSGPDRVVRAGLILGFRALAPRPGVSLVIDLGQVLKIQVGVDLGGADIGMAEEFLDGAQVAGGFQQMAGEGVAQQVGVQVAAGALYRRPVLEPLLDGAGVDAVTALADEEGRFPGAGELPAYLMPAPQGRDGLGTHGDATTLGALAEDLQAGSSRSMSLRLIETSSARRRPLE